MVSEQLEGKKQGVDGRITKLEKKSLAGELQCKLAGQHTPPGNALVMSG